MAGGLVLLLLVVLQGGAARAGEYCHGSAGGFQCPEWHDGAEATLCCGSCRLRYCCAASAARLEQGLCPSAPPQPGPHTPAPVPVYLPFLLVGSIFVAFVVCGICVGICCCKCLKSQDEEQHSGLAPGQAWLLEPDLPSQLPGSGSAARSAPGSAPLSSSICMNLAPALPVLGFPEDALYLSALPSSRRFLHPSCPGRSGLTDHATGIPASFLKSTAYRHAPNASPASAAQEDQKIYLGVRV
ncbi:SHSA1 protein, partial [Nothocercus nigrocapillus]|nr:SHSA1 protein [Nothocercus nigrocapillus]